MLTQHVHGHAAVSAALQRASLFKIMRLSYHSRRCSPCWHCCKIQIQKKRGGDFVCSVCMKLSFLLCLPLCLCSPYILFSDKLISSHCSWALQILVLNLPEELISSLQTLADTPPQGRLDWVGTEGQGIELEGGRGWLKKRACNMQLFFHLIWYVVKLLPWLLNLNVFRGQVSLKWTSLQLISLYFLSIF